MQCGSPMVPQILGVMAPSPLECTHASGSLENKLKPKTVCINVTLKFRETNPLECMLNRN